MQTAQVAGAPVRMNQSQLDLMLDAHERFATGRPGGRRLSLKFANLNGLDLSGRVLTDADLSGCSFEGAVMTTLRAPAFKCAAHLSTVVKTPVDSTI